MTAPGEHDSWYRHRPHPWHGLETGDAPPLEIDAFIELTPFDLIKYETDKRTGYLRAGSERLRSPWAASGEPSEPRR